MPSLDLYRKKLGATTDGRIRKIDADFNVLDTWDSDLGSMIGYFYDYDHDDYKTQLNNLNPIDDEKKVGIPIKYIVYSSQTFNKDAITYHIQFKPNFNYEEVIDYYKDIFQDRYSAAFPVGLYLDLPDEKGVYNKWLCVGLANSNDPQFPTYEILRCDYVIQWITNHVKYQMSAVLRSQSSYKIVRFISVMVCQKFSNCWNILLSYQYQSVKI